MSFWNYLGFAALMETLFGRNDRPGTNQRSQHLTPQQYKNREAALNARYNRLSDRIDELEGRLDEHDPDSELYEELDLCVDELREELYELEDERDRLDDEIFGFDDDENFDEHEDW